MSETDITNMSAEEISQHKANTMEKNAWSVAEEVRLRIDDQKGRGGDFMIAHFTNKQDELFFGDKEYLMKYYDSSKAFKKRVPGYSYYQKIEKFVELHCDQGDLYFEFRKLECEKRQGFICEYCSHNPPIIEKSCKIGPRPYPNYQKLPDLHYLDFSETPSYDEDGVIWHIDDFQPRTQLRKLFNMGNISSEKEENIIDFSNKYIVEVDLVKGYIKHLEQLKMGKEKRQITQKKKKENELQNQYENYDWKQLFEEKIIVKLTTTALDKYISHHTLGKLKLKRDKVAAVINHIDKSIYNQLEPENQPDEENLDVSSDNNSSESEDYEIENMSNNEEDHVLEAYSSSDESSSKSDSDMEVKEDLNTACTRIQILSGRRVSTPTRYKDYFAI